IPDTPTPSVNGQVVGSPALQASRSMLSLAPAARTLGWLGSTARAGSFCLFWEKTLSLLPTLTSVSGFNAQLGPAVSTATSKLRNPTSATRRPVRIAPPLGSGPVGRNVYYGTPAALCHYDR